MAGERLARVLAELSAGGGDGRVSSRRLCETSRTVTGVDGAGVMLMSGDVSYGSLCTTNEVSVLIEELQFSLGEGPCIDACKRGQVVAEPDLAHPATLRWPALVPPALDAGVRALFAFPLEVGAIRLGALDLYRASPGSLTDDQHADGLVLAEVVALWVLDAQDSAAPGGLAAALDADADLHLVVHNAAGMVSVQLGVSVAEALLRLRAYAFGQGRSLTDVADDVVARRLRLE